MAKILDKLNKTPIWQKILIVLILALAIVAGFHFTTWSKLDNEIANLNSEFEGLERRYREQKAVAEDLATFKQNIRKLEEDLRVALTQLPRDKEIPSLLRDVYSLGKKSGIDFKTFSPSNEVPRKMYAEVPIKLSLSGSFHEIAVFFDRVGKLSRIVNISDIDLSPMQAKDGLTNLNVNCTATTFTFLGGN